MDDENMDAERLRSQALDTLLSDPMFAAAIEAHGMSRTNLPWLPAEYATYDEIRAEGDGVRPALIVDSNGAGNLYWFRLAGHSFSYDLDADGRVLTITDVDLPSTTLTALTGRTLDAVAALPGSDRLRIIEAEARPVIATDRPGARITVGLRAETCA